MGQARKSPLMRPHSACVGSIFWWKSSQLGTRPGRKMVLSTASGSPTCPRFLRRSHSQVAIQLPHTGWLWAARLCLRK